MRGEFKLETYLTGTWEHIKEGDIYHGAFQFVVQPDGNGMRGKWIGFNQYQIINWGPWYWELITRSVDRKMKEHVLAKEV